MAIVTISTLILQAKTALDREPPLGKSIDVDFGTTGNVFIYPDNRVIYLGSRAAADCTITLSLEELTELEQGASITWALLSGKVEVEGDEDLAKKFGMIVAGVELAKPKATVDARDAVIAKEENAG